MTLKILITGMSASQASPKLAKKTTTFSGTLALALEARGFSVTHRTPSIYDTADTTLSEYDIVIVGVSPLLSLSANYAYGALAVINELLSHAPEKLRILIDAPDPEKIVSSLRAVVRTPNSLVKPIYKNRSGFSVVADANDATVFSKLHSTCVALAGGWNVKTIYPQGIGTAATQVASKLELQESQVCGISVDPFIIHPYVTALPEVRSAEWKIDAPKSKWFEPISHTIVWPWTKLKEHRGTPDLAIVDTMRRVAGVMVLPPESGSPWWSPRIAQAINANTVVSGDWRTLQTIDSSWGHLPSSIENMSHIDRFELSIAQRGSYLKTPLTTDEATSAIVKEISQ